MAVTRYSCKHQRRSRLWPRSALIRDVSFAILFRPWSPALLLLVDTMLTTFSFVGALVFLERIRKSCQRFAHLGSRCRYQLQCTRRRARTIKSTPEVFSGGETPGEYFQQFTYAVMNRQPLAPLSCVASENSKKRVHNSTRAEGSEQSAVTIHE